MDISMKSAQGEMARLLEPRAWMGCLMLSSMFMLAGALVSQYGFHLFPCELCMKQRYPYMCVMAICLAGLIRAKARKPQLAALGVCAFLLAMDAGIAGYHAGVEKGIFTGPDACTQQGGSSETLSLEDMRRQLMEAPIVACNQPQFEWHGLTLAGMNAAAATLLTLLTLAALIRMRRKPYGA
jgi:disulfide bond formation protein DsbB